MIATQSLSSSVLLPLLCPTPPVHSRVARSQLSDFEFVSKLPSITFLSSHKFSKRTRTSTVRGINSNDPKESAFFDENGVVEDMDSYLNYLSLEYDSVWDTKPSWCQPWTITLTGTVIISLSWLILHSAVATAVVMTTIVAWWYIFLYSYPKLQHVMTNEVSLNKVAVDQSYTIRETSKWLLLNFGTVRSLILSGESGDVVWFSIAVDAFGIFRHDCREKKECDKRSRKYTSNVRWTPLGQQYSVRWSRAYSNMIEERRKRVTKGLEDTYGERKSQ